MLLKDYACFFPKMAVMLMVVVASSSPWAMWFPSDCKGKHDWDALDKLNSFCKDCADYTGEPNLEAECKYVFLTSIHLDIYICLGNLIALHSAVSLPVYFLPSDALIIQRWSFQTVFYSSVFLPRRNCFDNDPFGFCVLLRADTREVYDELKEYVKVLSMYDSLSPTAPTFEARSAPLRRRQVVWGRRMRGRRRGKRSSWW